MGALGTEIGSKIGSGSEKYGGKRFVKGSDSGNRVRRYDGK